MIKVVRSLVTSACKTTLTRKRCSIEICGSKNCFDQLPLKAPIPIRLGIIGCGNVLEAYVPQCERLQAQGRAELLVACGRSSQRDRASALGVARFSTDESEVLRDP